MLLSVRSRNSRKALVGSYLTNTPTRLWDDCLEYEAYIRSHTVHDIFKLDGEVPEIMMTS